MRLWNRSLIGLLLMMVTAVLPAALGVAAADDPAAIFQRFIDARNRADVAEALALVADDIRFVGGPQCTPATPCNGAAAFRADLENNFIAGHAQATIVGAPQVSGTTVRARAEVRDDPRIRAAGVDRIINNLTAEVRDGKIANFLSVSDASDAQTAQYLAYQRAQQGLPSAPPRTGGGGEASFIRRLGDG
jgi:acetylornithine deacetylase/succinyl-diaminopimelate desuccinylase-like protein